MGSSTFTAFFTVLLAIMRPLAILVSMALGQLTVNLADGSIPWNPDLKWSLQTVITVMLGVTVLLAQWLTRQACEQAFLDRDKLKDEYIETLLKIISENTQQTQRATRRLPAIRNRVQQEMDELEIH